MNKKQQESKVDDYKLDDRKEQETFIHKKRPGLPISKKLQYMNLDDFLFPFDNTFSYHSAKSFLDSVYPNVETRFFINEDMHDEIVNRCQRKALANKNTEDLTVNSRTPKKN